MLTYTQKIVHYLQSKPEGAKKTEIAQMAKIPFYVTAYYLEKMVEKDYLLLSSDGIYTLNEKTLPDWLKVAKSAISAIPQADKELI